MAKTIKLELSLTASEWCELANAVSSKALQVENGRYDDGDEGEDTERWAKELRRVYKKVAAVLDKNKVTY